MPSSNGVVVDKTSEEYMDGSVYTNRSIRRYEKVFGRTFCSTGGLETTKEICSKLKFSPGMKVLDVGCGLGGSAIYMATTFGVEVWGVDLSKNMIAIAQQYKEEQTFKIKEKLHFEQGDARELKFPENHFDIIYSRDTINHIPGKEELFLNLLKWLRPGGVFLVTDYVRGVDEGKYSSSFSNYISERGYKIHTLKEYAQLLTNAGFKPVEATEVTQLLAQSTAREFQYLKNIKEDIIKEFSVEDFDYLNKCWVEKTNRVGSFEQLWGCFIATKPTM